MAGTIGFIGLGNMGQAMASRLLDTGWKLRVWNRSAAKAQPLVTRGAVLADSPEAAVEPGGMAISMLADDRAVDAIFASGSKVLSRLGSGGLHVSMSTIDPDTARRLSREHESAGVTYLASPVFGRPDVAAQGGLWMLVSGPAAARQRIQPVLDALGRGVFEFGEDPGAANVAKLCGNFLIASALEAIAEAAAMAEKCGAGAKPVIEMLTSTLFADPVYNLYGKLVVSRQFQPAGFRLVLGLKDVELALAAAGSARVPMPMASLVRDRALASISKGRGDWDWSSLSLESAEAAGLIKT
jgi:3-hydroxyisobutyrate dehydrogenase-like beta-hydroxyacid dehydrogenase